MSVALGPVAQLKLLRRLVRDLDPFFTTTVSAATAAARLKANLASREERFLGLAERAVFGRPESPYARLFDHVGVDLDELRALIRRDGLEGALAQLAEAGVHLRLDEFKGRRPIRRGSLEIPSATRLFDNPLGAKHIQVQSGGSRSTGTRVYVDLHQYANDAEYEALFWAAADLHGRPLALWRPAPPFSAGLSICMRHSRIGQTPRQWFAQSVPPLDRSGWRHRLVLELLLAASRWHGRPLPRPQHTPTDAADRVAKWLATAKREGRLPILNTPASGGVRVAIAARELGLDIAGTLFVLGGEPLTDARRRMMSDVGCTAVAHYSMGEVGRIGKRCRDGSEADDVHLLQDKIAMVRRPHTMPDGTVIQANYYTTLSSATAKLLINVESGDHTVMEQRTCDCPFGRVGLNTHLHTIRSYEKLTSEGMNFLGSDLLRLIDEVLPGRFGGAPTDYQFVEREDGQGLPKVDLRVSPKIALGDETEARDLVLAALNGGQGHGYGDRWREAGTLTIVRGEPLATGAAKILALHSLRKAPERQA
ncbi:MAG: hypothetical protein AB7I59_27135 [Geminicoccaceae bacterium]